MSVTDSDVACRCGAPARVSRVLVNGEVPSMIELMHVHEEVRHEHHGADLAALIGRLRPVADDADDDGY